MVLGHLTRLQSKKLRHQGSRVARHGDVSGTSKNGKGLIPVTEQCLERIVRYARASAHRTAIKNLVQYDQPRRALRSSSIILCEDTLFSIFFLLTLSLTLLIKNVLGWHRKFRMERFVPSVHLPPVAPLCCRIEIGTD